MNEVASKKTGLPETRKNKVMLCDFSTSMDGRKETALKAEGYKEALDVGIGIEKDSILFYSEMKKMIPDDKKEAVDNIIAAERRHLDKLTAIKEKI